MRKLIFLAIMIVGCASIAAAQTDYNKVEVYGGYSHARVDTGISDNDPALDDIVDEREGFNGFNAAVTGNVSRYVGFKFDVSGHFKQKNFPVGFIAASVDVDSTVYSFLGGVQLKDNSTETKFKPFAHALVGAAHARNEFEFSDNFCVAVFPSPCPANFTETDTGLAGAIGGGLDIRAGNRFDIRVIQFDYVPTRVFDATQHNFRIGAGIVFR